MSADDKGHAVRRVGRAADATASWLSRLLGTLTGVTMLVMLVVILADVVGRRLGSPVAGSYEVAESLMALVAFLPLAYVQRRAEHVAVTVATRKLPSRARAALDALGCLVGLAVVVLLFRWSLVQALEATAIGEHRIGLVRTPVWPFKWALPIGLGLFGVELVLSAVKHLAHAISGTASSPMPSEDALTEAA